MHDCSPEPSSGRLLHDVCLADRSLPDPTRRGDAGGGGSLPGTGANGVDGQLTLTAQSVAQLDPCTDDGPVMAYSLGVVAERVRAFSRAFAGRVAVRYAVKCNPEPGVLRAVALGGGGFEIASFAELQLVTAVGADPADVLYSNPVKPPAHIAAAHRAGVRRFAVDSPEELAKIAEYAPGSDVYVRLRVDDGSSRFPLSAKFGTDTDQAEQLLLAARALGLGPAGLTFHVGSQCTDPDAWARALRRCAPLMASLARHGVVLQLLDIGGGFPAQYGDEHVPGLEEIGARVVAAIDALPYVPTELVCEPGRGVVAEAAVIVATVIGRAERNGRCWVYTDVGAYNGLMEAAQSHAALAYPLATSSATSADVVMMRCTVTGPSCDSSDTLLRDSVLPATIQVGDRLFLGTAGAYSICYASGFNGFPPPRPTYVG